MRWSTDWSLSTSIDNPCQVPLDVPRRLAPITVHPLCCNCSAHDCPMPADAPVTRTTFLVMDSLLRTVCGSSKRTDLSPRRSLRTPARPQRAVRRVADGCLGVRLAEVVGRRIRDRVEEQIDGLWKEQLVGGRSHEEGHARTELDVIRGEDRAGLRP